MPARLAEHVRDPDASLRLTLHLRSAFLGSGYHVLGSGFGVEVAVLRVGDFGFSIEW